MIEILQIEKRNVIKAAESCPQARGVLSKLFPNVFYRPIYCGSRFVDEEGTEWMVTHAIDKHRVYYLVNLKTGYSDRRIEFSRDGAKKELTLIDYSDEFYKNYRMVTQ